MSSTNVSNLVIHRVDRSTYQSMVKNPNELYIITDELPVQLDVMPTAAQSLVGQIVQFKGTTDANYANGYFYKCVQSGSTYFWMRVDVQPGGATYTAGNGISIDANNEISVTAPTLTNVASGTGSYCVGGNTGEYVNSGNYSVGVGNSVIMRNGSNNVYVGSGSNSMNLTGSYNVAIGANSATNANNNIAIGYRAEAQMGCIQFTMNNAQNYSNQTVNTFKVANANGNFEIMSADGTVPTDRFTTTPSADGTYVPTLTIASGVATRTWSAPASGTSSISVTLPAASWSSSTQTVTATGVTASNTVIVGAAPASASEYNTSGVICTAQGTDSLTFSCSTTPSNDLTVTVLIM